ncbi:MAG: hypothetical protein HQK55_16170, partial [Deltaproteobacteria bacterium]|nr:hypothetical protein [Deltaproteobacteria bacterium]
MMPFAIYPLKRKIILIVVVNFLGMILLAASVLADSEIKFIAPTKVSIGQPFLIRITSRQPMDAVTIKWSGQKVALPVNKTPEGYVASALLGSDVKTAQAGAQALEASILANGRETALQKSVALLVKNYPQEHLKVEPRLVTPPPEALERIKVEAAVINKALTTVSPKSFWNLPFSRPVKGKALSVYGMRRIYNNKPGGAHRGVDFAAGAGEPIKAAQAGRIILV